MSQGVASILRRLPPRWGAVAVVCLIGYAIVQPMINRQFGLQLPGLSNGVATTADQGQSRDADSPAASNIDDTADTTNSTGAGASANFDLPVGSLSKASTSDSDQQIVSGSAPQKTAASDNTSAESSDDDLLYGLLKEIRKDVYQSPAGLIYGPGSEEGHRLRHLERHAQDIPDRPGKHGVFDGGMEAAVKIIDDAYERAKKGSRGTRRFDENGRTRYEVSFDKPIGYVGGREGAKNNNPAAKQIRIIVEGNKIVTAFPF